MGMEMKLQFKLSQQLVMTPQLVQAIRLLQLSRLELYSAERPFLEELLPEAGGATVGWQSDGTQRLLCTTPVRAITWGQIKAMYR
jgi:hypothetical protein